MKQQKAQVYTVKELAFILKVSRHTILNNWRSMGLAPAVYRLNGRVMRFKRSVLETLPEFKGIELP